jgi:hypothetical protein
MSNRAFLKSNENLNNLGVCESITDLCINGNVNTCSVNDFKKIHKIA